MPELLLGCGRSREKKVSLPGRENWSDLVTLDRFMECEPDIFYDLEQLPYPFKSNTFDEIHAYCVLEHTGTQGNWRFFFDQFTEFWRISKPGATFHALVPRFDSPWAWGDPSHSRIISLETITFLSQVMYVRNNENNSPMSDFRWYYKADWELVANHNVAGSLAFVLRANK